MRSRIYESRVLHHRFSPREHRFSYRLFYFAFDLDELSQLHRSFRSFSLERWNLFSFRDEDYLPLYETSENLSRGAPLTKGLSLKERVLLFAAQHGIGAGGVARVELVTLPRIFGHHFNPVSFYFGYDASDAAQFAIAEVTNTFREVKPYFIPLAGGVTAEKRFHLRTPKHFYVSPFSDVDVAFDFSIRAPAQKLAIQIDDYVGEQRTLHSVLTGEAVPITESRLLRLLFTHPLVSMKIISMIHWQAFQLWRKRVPHYPKAARPDAQRGLYRPHHSISRSANPP